MTSVFLTTAQREFLLQEYKELLEKSGAKNKGYLLEQMKAMDNVTFWAEICDFMPIYAKPGMLAKVMAFMEKFPKAKERRLPNYPVDLTNLDTFFDEIHPFTLQYFEAELLPKLKRIDKLNWMQSQIDDIKELDALNN